MTTDLKKLAHLTGGQPIKPEPEPWWPIIIFVAVLFGVLAFISMNYQRAVDTEMKRMTTTTTLQEF